MSELNEIAKAYAQAQSKMTNPVFDSMNPHFKNKFASLAAVRNVVVKACAAEGICVSQNLTTVEGGIACETWLTHSSGQQMRFGPLVIPVTKNDAQGFASAATYAKRVSMMAVAAVVGDDDDDANAATGKPAYAEAHTPVSPEVRNVTEDRAREVATIMRGVLELDLIDDVKSLKVLDKLDELNKHQEEYQAAWGQMSAPERKTWKILVEHGKKIQQRPMMANGRAS